MADYSLISARSRPILFGALLLGLAGCGGDDMESSSLIPWPDKRATGAEPGQAAPNFVLETSDGTPLTLASLTGTQPLVVNFLATWCANCMEEMGLLVDLHESGVPVLGVNLREEPETVQGLMDRTGAGFPILLDRTGKVTRAYKVVNLPATVVLAPDGRIATITRGPISADGIRESVAAALDRG
ncbi:MAG TPA: TlpA disulfide reductase family protein [Thermomicrobiales bacterium]|nr:TlpA disulfide reductase family protein [Thermomicrobiales bacterium]